MGKIVLGFLIGAATTAVAFALLDAPSGGASMPDYSVSGSDHSISGSEGVHPSASSDIGSRAINLANEERQVPAPTAAATELPRFPEGGSLSRDEVERQLEELERAYGEARMQLTERWADSILDTEPAVLPSPLRPELGWVSENMNADFFHQRFEREMRDQSWAGETENRITTYISDQTDFIEKYGYPRVECRSTRCIMTFAGYGVEDPYYVITREMSSVTQGLRDQLGDVVDCPQAPGEFCVTEANNKDGVATIYWGIRRNEK